MTTNSNCGCGCGGSSTPCDSAIAELPRYYPRQLITPADLTLEQDYFRDRMRRHNRLVHGWGVVCGALVCPVPVTNPDNSTSFAPWVVQVQPGYILGPYGDEIILDCMRTVDVRTQGVSGVCGEPCIDAPDPWCTEVFTPPTATTPTIYYISVKYVQSMTRPVRVQPVGCGCDDSSCEYSRWHDGYQIGVLTTCPKCNACDQRIAVPEIALPTLGSVEAPPCPDCTCGPWVCLAAVTVSSDGTIAQIDNCSCRRIVFSWGNTWRKCTTSLRIDSVVGPSNSQTPVSVTADGSTQVQVTVNGTNLEADAQATYSFGPGITAVPGTTSRTTTGLTTMTLTVTAAPNAAPGPRNLVVRNADCSTFMLPAVIQVVSAQKTGPVTGQNPAPAKAAPPAAKTAGKKTPPAKT